MALTLRKGGSSTAGRSSTLQYEVFLKEMLTKAGCDQAPHSPPDVKRLACHMQLFQELHRSNAFGSLTGVMTMVLDEIIKSMYTTEVIADPLFGVTGRDGTSTARLPFFAALARKEQEIFEISQHASKLEQQMAGRANAEQGLKDQLQACTERHQMLEATITKLEYEVAKAKDVARSTLEEMELTRGKDQSSIRLLEHELGLAKEQANAAAEENKMLKAREDVEVRMREHFSMEPSGEEQIQTGGAGATEASTIAEQATTMIKQLLVLQNGRIEDFEARMANALSAAIPSTDHIEEVKSYFSSEMISLHHEIQELDKFRKASKSAHDTDGAGDEADDDYGGRQSGQDLDTSQEGLYPELDVGPDGQRQSNRLPSGFVERLWHTYRIFADGNEQLLSPMVPRLCSEKELLSTIDRVLHDNFEAVCPYITWTAESLGSQPKGRRRNPADHPQAGHRQFDSMAVAERVAIPAADYFYKHQKERYGCHEVAMLVSYSVLKAVEEHHSKFSKVMLLGKIIAGDVDDALWQYALQCEWLMANHPRAPSWQVSKVSHFESFWRLLHPQLVESEISSASKEVSKRQQHVGFSNSIVAEYIVSKLLNKTEPRLKRWMKVLKWRDTMNTNIVYRLDIVSIAPKIFPELNPKVVDLAFCIASQKHGGDSMPLESMAYLACHLEAITISWPAHV